MKSQVASREPLVSAIVPVYRCEDVLQECVESVLTQTYGDFELILVDDGSPDRSGEICDAYALSDGRVQVVHKANGGTSSARNAGIDVARGAYLMFLDNDDWWISSQVLERVAFRLVAARPDVLVFLHEEFWEGSGKTTLPVPPVSPRKRAPHYPLSESGDFFESATNLTNEYVYSGAVWQCAFRRELVTQNAIRFPEGMRNEDLAFCFEALRHAESIDYLGEPLYVWRRGVPSTQSAGIPTRGSAVDLARMLLEWAEEARLCEPRRRALLETYLAPIYAVWLGYAYLYGDAEAQEQRDALKPYAYLLDVSARRDVGLIRCLTKIFGQGFTGHLLALRYKLLARFRR